MCNYFSFSLAQESNYKHKHLFITCSPYHTSLSQTAFGPTAACFPFCLEKGNFILRGYIKKLIKPALTASPSDFGKFCI